MICPDCNGTGKNLDPIFNLGSDECFTCYGNGRIFLVSEITVPIEGQIPAEVELEKCKYLNECLEGEVMACYTSPERCDIFKRKQSWR